MSSKTGITELVQMKKQISENIGGSTALVVAVYNNILYVANVGDSKCLIYTNNQKIIKMSVLHNP